MKKVLCFILLTNVSSFVFGQSMIKIKTDMYEFPIKQGTKNWEQFESVAQRIAALQVPNTVLETISTEGLLETCLQFPYLTDFLFCNDHQKGFEALVSEFNGFKELLKRQDLTNVLFKKYNSVITEVITIQDQNDVERGRFAFRHFILEFILAQDVVFKNLTQEQEKQLFLLSLENTKIKNRYSEIFSDLNTISVNLLYAKKILNDPDFKFENAEQKKVLSDFVQTPVFLEQRVLDNIENYINVKFK
jgi:hypothetical protein